MIETIELVRPFLGNDMKIYEVLFENTINK